jgi:hypothetical protein
MTFDTLPLPIEIKYMPFSRFDTSTLLPTPVFTTTPVAVLIEYETSDSPKFNVPVLQGLGYTRKDVLEMFELFMPVGFESTNIKLSK